MCRRRHNRTIRRNSSRQSAAAVSCAERRRQRARQHLVQVAAASGEAYAGEVVVRKMLICMKQAAVQPFTNLRQLVGLTCRARKRSNPRCIVHHRPLPCPQTSPASRMSLGHLEALLDSGCDLDMGGCDCGG